MERTVDNVTIELERGDITDQGTFEAIVNAANARLMPGGGVAGAIHREAGSGLADECRPLAPIEPGEAVITGAHDLPNRWVIHCLGPVYGEDEPPARLLAQCYERALRLAEENGVESIAFPSISTGAFGYPIEKAARIALRTIVDVAPGLVGVRRIRFVLWGEEALAAHEEALAEIIEG